MNRTIEILIGQNGALAIDVIGFKVSDCDQTTKFLEAALGLTAEKRRNPEWHQTNHRQHQQRLGA